MKREAEEKLSQVKGVPLVAISALRGQGLDRLMKAVLAAYAVWNRRIATAALNRWLEEMVQRHPPPAPGGRRIKIRYMTQANARPPTFAVFCSNAEALPASYVRYSDQRLARAVRISRRSHPHLAAPGSQPLCAAKVVRVGS